MISLTRSLRSLVLDLTMFFKCLVGLVDFDLDQFVEFYDVGARSSSRSVGLNLLKVPLVRTVSFNSSYFNRIVLEWNALPAPIRQCSSLFTFKRMLKCHYKTLLEDNFDPDNLCTWTTSCRCQSCGCYRVQHRYT